MCNRARHKQKEAFALAERLQSEVGESSELVTQRMKEHGSGSAVGIETKRSLSIRQETEHALAARNTKLLRKIKAMVKVVNGLAEQNATLASAANAAKAAHAELTGPTPEKEALSRITQFELEETRQQLRAVTKACKEAQAEKMRYKKRVAKKRVELKNQANHVLALSRTEDAAADEGGAAAASARGLSRVAPAAELGRQSERGRRGMGLGQQRAAAAAEMQRRPAPPQQPRRMGAPSGFRLPQIRAAE